MGCNKNPVCMEHGIVRLRRFFTENIQTSTGNLPGLHCLDQRSLIHCSATGGVDEIGSRLHLPERLGTQKALGFLGQTHVQADIIRLRQTLLQRNCFHTRCLRLLRRNIGVVAEHLHAHCLCLSGNGSADSAKPDDEQLRTGNAVNQMLGSHCAPRTATAALGICQQCLITVVDGSDHVVRRCNSRERWQRRCPLQ